MQTGLQDGNNPHVQEELLRTERLMEILHADYIKIPQEGLYDEDYQNGEPNPGQGRDVSDTEYELVQEF
jgi:hypothetical protein